MHFIKKLINQTVTLKHRSHSYIPNFIIFFIRITFTKQVFMREPKIKSTGATKHLSIVESVSPEVKQNITGVNSRKIQHRNGRRPSGMKAGENLAVVFKPRRDGRTGELRRTTVNVVVESTVGGEFLGKRERDFVWLVVTRMRYTFH